MNSRMHHVCSTKVEGLGIFLLRILRGQVVNLQRSKYAAHGLILRTLSLACTLIAHLRNQSAIGKGVSVVVGIA